ncbi:retrovirus-related pol polyprotein from transposon TNT 1-94 [Tanacetum coccineum]
MTTLADKAILSGADNRPPMLEKDMYDSWKSIMELYMMNRQHGRMILESVENGPLIWPTIEENGVTRPKKYSELSATEAIQADCDIKATNIILQGLPPEVYALVSNHKVAKELWERIQLLMQGTSLTKQERECKLYDEFDKFAYKKGETLRDFYLRFSLLLNDMNIYNMKLEQFQVNTKFLNTLPPEWSKFVIDVKLVTQSPYQTHQNSYQNSQFQPQVSLCQSPQYESPYQCQQYSNNQSSTPLSITYPSNDYQSSVHYNVYSPPSSIHQLEYTPTVNQQQQQHEFPQLDLGLTVSVFKQGDDPIDAISHMLSFLSAVVISRYPTTNNQLWNSSNPMQQATINNGRVTLQPIQGRQISFTTSTSRTYTPGASGSNSGKQRIVICYNCKGEGHMSKQCIKPKRKRDDSWFKDKVLLVQAQSNGQILHEEELTFLADPGTAEDALVEVHNPNNVDNNIINQGVQVVPSSEQSNVVNHSETEITSDSNIIPYSQYVIESQQATINLDNKSANDTLTAELERYKEQVKVLKEGQNVNLKSNDNVLDSSAQSVEIDRLKQTLSEHLKEIESLIQTVTLLKNNFKKEESRNIDREIALEKRIKQLDNIVFKRDQFAQNVYMLTKPQFFYDHTTKQALGFQNPFYLKKAQQLEPMLYDDPILFSRPTNVEVPKEIHKVSYGIKPSTSASGSQPSGNTREIRSAITQVVLENKHSKLNANYELKCVKCNGCMLSDNRDLCVLDYINNVNARVKSKSVKKISKRKVWKPTGKVITTTTEVPLRKPTALDNESPKPVITLVYLRKPRKSKTHIPVSKSKVVQIVLWYLDSGCSKHMTGLDNVIDRGTHALIERPICKIEERE